MNALSYAHPQLFNAMVERERLEDDGIGDELMEMQEMCGLSKDCEQTILQ